MNSLQKTFRWAFSKAIGFPAWRTDNWPNGMSILGLSTTEAGIDVSPLGSMQSAAVYGCCSILNRVIAPLPKQVFKDTPTGKVKATDHWSYPLLHRSPNAAMSSIDFYSALLLAFNLHGNAFVQKQKLAGRVVALWPLHPERMRIVVPDSGQISYVFTKKNGEEVPLTADDVIHIRNFSIDGINGISPISAAREVIGQDLASQRYGSSVLRNGGFIRGVIRSKQAFNKEKADRWRTTFDSTYGGSGNSGKVGILWEDAAYDPISIKPVDLEYMAGRRFSATEIACLFGVPVSMLAQSDKPPTYASSEQFDLQFVKYTVAPICMTFEQQFDRGLYGYDPTIYNKFSLAALLRGDSTAQATFMSSMAQNGFMTRNEGRDTLDLPRSNQAGADELTVQSNLLDLNQLSKLLPSGQPAGGGNQQ
jgi:HK97 family phage portal protein